MLQAPLTKVLDVSSISKLDSYLADASWKLPANDLDEICLPYLELKRDGF